MINQAAPVVATALLYSLYAGVISYAILRIVLAAFKKMRPIYAYHLCNIALVVPLAVFVVPLAELPEAIQTAPVAHIMPAVAMTSHIISQPAGNISTTTVAADTNFQAGEIWTIVNDTIMANSNYIMLLYLAGLFIFSVRLLLQYLQSRNLKTKGIEPVNELWRGLFEQTKKQLGIHSAIRIAFTSRNISPCIIGHAKAIILIPVSIANNLTTEQTEAILLHELGHYKQYDHYINLIIQCTKCVLFFNPFVWLTARLCDSYRELACDDTATRYGRNIELAETLAIIAQMSTAHNSLAMNLKKRSPLMARIQALLRINTQEKTSHRWLPVIVTTILLTTALLIAGSTKLFSTEKDKLKEQLEEISAEMYRAGNEKYIFVDAVIDSLIFLPSHTDMLYMGDSYWGMDGNKGKIAVPERTKEKYIAKLQRFLTAQGEDKYAVVRFDATRERTPLTLVDILNPSSAFRTVNLADRYNAGIVTKAWKKIFAEMYQDGLIRNRDEHFEMKYGIKGIEVNGAKLTRTQDAKYRRLYKDILGLDLNNASVSGRMSSGDLKKYLGDGSVMPDITTMHFTKEELEEISKELFDKGLPDYILIDAIKDGYIRDGEQYHTIYKDGVVVIEGKQLSAEHQAAYNKRIKQFVQQFESDGWHGSTKSTANFKEIADRNSFFRTKTDIHEHPGGNPNYMHDVMMAMHKDGLIDTAYRVIINYNSMVGVLIVNEVELDEAIAEKYIPFIRKNNPGISKGNKVSVEYEYNSKAGLSPATRKYVVGKEKLRELRDEQLNFIYAEMLKDRLIDTNHRTEIDYRGDNQLFLNMTEMEGEAAKKYLKLFKEADAGYARNNKASFIYTWYIDKPFPQKYYDRLNKFTENDALTSLSNVLFKSGSQSFAIVDAIRDGYIKEGEPYSINYRGGKFSINGKNIPADKRKRYEDKLEQFRKLYGDSVNMWGTISSTVKGTVYEPEFTKQFGIMLPKSSKADREKETVKKTNKTSSITLYSGPLIINNSKGSEKDLKALVHAMEQDGLIHVNSYYVVEYMKNGVRINARPLTGSNATKYSNMLQAMGDKPGAGTIIKQVPEGVKIPDYYIGDIKYELKTNGDNLPAIAEVMFVDGNPNFILAHALHDGLLKERQSYNYKFAKGKTYWKGKLLAEPLQTKYTKLMQDFLKAHNSKKESHKILGEEVTKKELNNPDAPIRNSRI